MPRACLPFARTTAVLKTAALAGLLTISASAAGASGIDCKTIGTAYDNLFANANDRVQAILTEFKALPAGATEQKKDAIRKRFCAVGGELVGFYKFVQSLGNDCVKQGDNMTELMDVVNKQLDLAKQGIKTACEQ
jgi:hypothetical protein